MSDQIAETIISAYEEAIRAMTKRAWIPGGPLYAGSCFQELEGGAVPVFWLREQIAQLRVSMVERDKTDVARLASRSMR